jgi:predicted metal-dependent hydrolase
VQAASRTAKATALTVEDVLVSVVRKRVKNVNLRVYPPAGDVVVSVPLRMPEGVVREVVTDRLPWIRRQRSRYASAQAARFLEYVDGEEHHVFGLPYTLRRACHRPSQASSSSA